MLDKGEEASMLRDVFGEQKEELSFLLGKTSEISLLCILFEPTEALSFLDKGEEIWESSESFGEWIASLIFFLSLIFLGKRWVFHVEFTEEVILQP